MLKRKPSFYAYLLPIAAFSFVHLMFPAVAHAAHPKKRIKVHKKHLAAIAPAPVLKNRYLSLSEAQNLVSGLNISVFPGGANGSVVKLTGLVPHECSSQFRVDSTALHPEVNANGVQGFAIVDTGDFAGCVAKAGKCSEDTACDSLSTIKPNPEIAVDGSKTVAIAYLNHANRDAALHSNFDAADIGKDRIILLSDDEKKQIAQDKKDKEAAERALKLQQSILVCAQSRDGINDARDMLAKSGFDDATISQLQAKIDAYQKQFDEQDATLLTKKLQRAIDGQNIDQFDDLEDQVYTFLGDHPEQGNKLAGFIYQMAQVRTTSDDANDSSVDRAEQMINRALDPDTGIKMSAKNTKTFEDALRMSIPSARLQVAYSEFESLRDKKGAYDMWGRPVRATAQAYKHYTELAKQMDKKMESELKAKKCENMWGAPSDKRDSNRALDEACSQLEDQRQALMEVPQKMEQMRAESIARAQQAAAARQMPAQGVTQQMPQQQMQIPMGIPTNTMSTGLGQIQTGQFAPMPSTMNTGAMNAGTMMNMGTGMMPTTTLGMNGIPSTSAPYYFK